MISNKNVPLGSKKVCSGHATFLPLGLPRACLFRVLLPRVVFIFRRNVSHAFYPLSKSDYVAFALTSPMRIYFKYCCFAFRYVCLECEPCIPSYFGTLILVRRFIFRRYVTHTLPRLHPQKNYSSCLFFEI